MENLPRTGTSDPINLPPKEPMHVVRIGELDPAGNPIWRDWSKLTPEQREILKVNKNPDEPLTLDNPQQ